VEDTKWHLDAFQPTDVLLAHRFYLLMCKEDEEEWMEDGTLKKCPNRCWGPQIPKVWIEGQTRRTKCGIGNRIPKVCPDQMKKARKCQRVE
jgi:hypothetical protein